MVHGLHFHEHHRPRLARMSGEQALNTAGILLIALFVLVLAFYAALGYL